MSFERSLDVVVVVASSRRFLHPSRGSSPLFDDGFQ